VSDRSLLARKSAIVLYLAVQTAVLAYGLYMPDHVFGFQMFNETSRINVHLLRQVRGQAEPVPVVEGAWEAVDRHGQIRTFRWADRVRYRPLMRLDTFVHASYGLDAQLYRLERAMVDVLSHIPDDTETTGLIAHVETRRNGRPVEVVQIVSARHE
jgi:hypothetical protein